MNVAYTADLPDRVSHEKGVSRYVRELLTHLTDRGVAVESVTRPPVPVDIDLLHITAPRVRYLPLLASRVPAVVTVHGLDFYWPPRYRAAVRQPAAWLQQRLLPLMKGRAAHYIVPSGFLKREIVAGRGVEPERVTAVPHGVSDLFHRPSGCGTNYLLTTTPKAPVIAALAGVRDAGHDVRLTVVGKRGYGYDEARQAAARLGVADAVGFAGHVDDAVLADLYANALAYVHWSGTETFGLPPVEAMAASTPVVSNDAGSLPEVVGDGGVVVEAVDGCISEVIRLIEATGYRDDRIRAGREWVRRYTWERTARETKAVYERVFR